MHEGLFQFGQPHTLLSRQSKVMKLTAAVTIHTSRASYHLHFCCSPDFSSHKIFVVISRKEKLLDLDNAFERF